MKDGGVEAVVMILILHSIEAKVVGSSVVKSA